MPFSLVPFAAKHRAPPCLRRTVASTASGIRLAAVAILSVSVLCMGACTDEPSESSMHQAAKNYVEESNRTEREAAKRMGRAGPPDHNITTFKKIDCTSTDQYSGHKCTFEVSVDGKNLGKQGGRFFKNNDGRLVYAEK